MAIEIEMFETDLSPDNSTVKQQIFVHLQVKLNVHYTSCKFSCHILARWKSDLCKWRGIPMSFVPSIAVLQELLSCSFERKKRWKEGEEMDWMFIFWWMIIILLWQMIFIRPLRFVLSDNPCFLVSTNKKKCRQQGLGIIWELQTIKPVYYVSQTRHRRSLKAQSNWISCESTKKKETSALLDKKMSHSLYTGLTGVTVTQNIQTLAS